MNRTAEKTLSIISIVLNLFSIVGAVLAIIVGKMLINDPYFEDELYNEFIIDPTFTASDAEFTTQFIIGFLNVIAIIGWLVVIAIVVAIILSIIGIVKVNKNAKTAGIMFLISFILSGLFSIQGILLLVASIMCFVRKPKETPPAVSMAGANDSAPSFSASNEVVATEMKSEETNEMK